MKKRTITFTDVGRGKASFTAEVSVREGELDYSAIARAAKRGGGLMSSDIEVTCEPDALTGFIVVGGFRPVGKWSA